MEGLCWDPMGSFSWGSLTHFLVRVIVKVARNELVHWKVKIDQRTSAKAEVPTFPTKHLNPKH